MTERRKLILGILKCVVVFIGMGLWISTWAL